MESEEIEEERHENTIIGSFETLSLFSMILGAFHHFLPLTFLTHLKLHRKMCSNSVSFFSPCLVWNVTGIWVLSLPTTVD